MSDDPRPIIEIAGIPHYDAEEIAERRRAIFDEGRIEIDEPTLRMVPNQRNSKSATALWQADEYNRLSDLRVVASKFSADEVAAASAGFEIGDSTFPMGGEDDMPEGDLNGYRQLYADATGSNRELRTMICDLHEESTKMTAQLQATTQQRDILSRQVDSLVQRLAGLHVAHGTMDMAAAQGFVQKEILPINQVLQQIAASQQEAGQ